MSKIPSNVSGGLAHTPRGELDAWVRTDSLAEVTGVAEDEIRQGPSAVFKPYSSAHMDFVIPLKSTAETVQERLSEPSSYVFEEAPFEYEKWTTARRVDWLVIVRGCVKMWMSQLSSRIR